MGQSTQRCLDATGDDRDALVRFTSPLAIGQGGSVRPQPDAPTWRISIIVADFAIGRVVVDHAVHVPCADRKEQSRPAKALPILARLPVRLTDQSDAIPSRLEDPSEDRHRETRVIDVSVPGDEDHVELVPASGLSLLHRHGQGSLGQRSMRLTFSKVVQVTRDDVSVGVLAGHPRGSARGLAGLRFNDRQWIVHRVSKRFSGARKRTVLDLLAVLFHRVECLRA